MGQSDVLLRTCRRTHWNLGNSSRTWQEQQKSNTPIKKKRKVGLWGILFFEMPMLFFYFCWWYPEGTHWVSRKKIKKEIRVQSRCSVKHSAVGFTKIRVAVGSALCDRLIFWDWVEGKVPIPKALCYTVSSEVSVFYEWMGKQQTQVPICIRNGPLPDTTHPSNSPYPNRLGAWVCEFAFDEFS
jgi:hypothetical protein